MAESHQNQPAGPENALFVCFGGLSNVGTLSGLAALEVVRELTPRKACIFCLGALPARSESVMEKTQAARRIITVDGCDKNCARNIVVEAGFQPTQSITIEQDCGIEKKPTFAFGEADVQKVKQAILDALRE
ncbi:MAG: putative zinc-binding protein [Anaerolineae bacterium]|nr:putative zinc-binding protein [Anaerolineae bacterium]